MRSRTVQHVSATIAVCVGVCVCVRVQHQQQQSRCNTCALRTCYKNVVQHVSLSPSLSLCEPYDTQIELSFHSVSRPLRLRR